jgi:hypothetical protein
MFCYPASAGAPGSQDSPELGRVEAIYLGKILQFVQWPAEQGIQNETFRVCVAGRNSMSFPLAQELRASLVAGRRVEVRMIAKDQGLRECQVLFVGTTNTKRRSGILDSVKGIPILTVGDDQEFLEAGGILRLNNDKNQMQFEVNLQGARSAGLKIDARLLAMAHRVMAEHKEVAGI